MKDNFLKFKNVISTEQCLYLRNAFEVVKEVGVNLDLSAPDTNRADNSFGFGTNFSPYTEVCDQIRPYLIPLLDANEELEQLGIYTREYFDAGAIKRHLDFKSQISVSLCIHNSAQKAWPLKADIAGVTFGDSADVGDMLILTNADRNLHWRDPLACAPNESVIQIIYFWRVNKIS